MATSRNAHCNARSRPPAGSAVRYSPPNANGTSACNTCAEALPAATATAAAATIQFVKLFIVGDRDVAIRCGTLALDVREGVGRTRALALDTADTRIAGRGTMDFKDQRFDLVLDPQPKDPGLFAKRRSIKVDGPFSSPRVSLSDPVQIAAPGC